MEENQIQVIKPPITIVPKKKSKTPIVIISIIAVFLILFGGATTFLTLNGTWKKLACESSSEDSFLYTKFQCKTYNLATAFTQNDVVTLDKSNINSTEDLVTKLVDTVSNSVVTIAASTQLNAEDLNTPSLPTTQEQNIGSGFIVRSDGLIVTNNHVVEDSTLDYFVILNNDKNPIPVTKIYKDTAGDIAIIKIDKTGLPALKLGDSDLLKRGNSVVAMGSPLGDLTGTVTTGIISGLNRDVTAGGGSTASERIQGVIQTDAAVNPGNSGGPLLNSNGEVIGVNFATTQGAENISFAIPINRVKAKLLEFQNYGKLLQPFIGVAFIQKPYYLKQGIVTGAFISQVQAGSPAEKAGILKGDLITTVNDKSLETESLQNIIQTSKVGDSLNLAILRKEQKVNITVVVGDRAS